MILLIAFAFLAGIVTILSPCILPILPVVLSSSFGGKEMGKARPMGVVVGFVLSFTFFTLFLSTIVKISGISPDVLRTVSVIVITGLGVSLLIPSLQLIIERLFQSLSRLLPKENIRPGFGPGILTGISLGLLWTPCVGPILASVISLAISGTVTFDAFIITFAYSLGTAIPMLIVMLGGQEMLRKVPLLLTNTAKIQKAFGILMIITAISMFFNVDRSFQTYILNTFPQYGIGLTKFEDNKIINQELKKISVKKMKEVKQGPYAPEIIPGGEWFNSKPLSLAELKGKVILIDFWTYTCINCQRTFPYLKKWWNKYQDKGLVIIGVHSPEFEFEKNKNNLAKAVSDFGLTYPIVQDNDFQTWKAYDNQYWPAKYLIDKDGIVRYSHFGEGNYDETEKKIQELLKETSAANIPQDITNPTQQTYGKTHEAYLGAYRIAYLTSPEVVQVGTVADYSYPDRIADNSYALKGKWNVMDQYARPLKGSELSFRFDAKEVYLVMKTTGAPATIKVSVDGKLQYFGADSKNGVVTVDGDRLYKLVLLPSPGKHLLKLEFEDSNAQLFAFTFG